MSQLTARLLFQHPGILASAALRAVDHQASLLKCHARQSAGHDDDFFAIKDIRPQVDAPAFKAIVAEAWMLAEFHDGLGDKVSRVGDDLFCE